MVHRMHSLAAAISQGSMPTMPSTPQGSTKFRKPWLSAAGPSGCFLRPDVACKLLSTYPARTHRSARVGLVVAG